MANKSQGLSYRSGAASSSDIAVASYKSGFLRSILAKYASTIHFYVANGSELNEPGCLVAHKKCTTKTRFYMTLEPLRLVSIIRKME